MKENFSFVPDKTFANVLIGKSEIHHDLRGHFFEFWDSEMFKDLDFSTPVQANFSSSSKGVIRGFHFQREPWAQAKIIHCISGSIQDVVVDIRRDSSSFGSHTTVELFANTGEFIVVPRGFAHGFQAMEDKTNVVYFVDNKYEPNFEVSINPLDLNIATSWRIKDPIVSIKDMRGFSLEDYRRLEEDQHSNRGGQN